MRRIGSGRRCRVSLPVAAVVFIVLQVLIIGIMFYGNPPPAGNNCNPDNNKVLKEHDERQGTSSTSATLHPPAPHLRPLHALDKPEWGDHRLAVVVPFRDRLEELLEFVPYMHAFLDAQHVRHKFFIVNQMDNLRFNRASLINIGFLQAEEECDYFAMHDVDLLPENPDIKYYYPENGPYHVAAPELHPKYHYATFVGGILMLNNQHFRQINGLSNKYWGWGKEDDEFYVRMREANLTISRPKNIKTGYKTFRHIHEKRRRARDIKRYYDQKMKSRIRDRLTGLNNVKYTLDSARELSIEGAPATLLNVMLHCDLNVTPWCITPVQAEEITAYLQAKKAELNDPPPLDGQTRKPILLPSVDFTNIILHKDWS